MDRRQFLALAGALAIAGCTDGAPSDAPSSATAGGSGPEGSSPPPGSEPMVRTDGPYRPQFHFSPASGNLADPNGLVVVDGEHHLFHQADGRWAHAVSTDRWHWHDLPVALEPDALGLALSGSAVVVREPDPVLAQGPAVVAVYTSTTGGEAQSIASSTDRARTFTRLDGNPVIGNDGRKDFRDPKVFWHPPSARWVMVVSVGDRVSVFGSADLVTWEHLSDAGDGVGLHTAVWECPDLVPLALDGDRDDLRWVLHTSVGDSDATRGSTAQWVVGRFDGTTFVPDEPVNTGITDFGQDFYAAQTWYDEQAETPVWIAWMGNWRYPYQTPTGTWHGAMSVPRSLALETRDGSPTLVQRPVDDATLRDGEPRRFRSVTVHPGGTWSPDFRGACYRLDATLSWEGADEVGVRVRQGGDSFVATALRPRDGEVFVDRSTSGTEPLPTRDGGTVSFGRRTAAWDLPGSGTTTVTVVVDRCSVEVFWDDGRLVGTQLVFTALGNDRIEWYAVGGTLHLDVELARLGRIFSPRR